MGSGSGQVIKNIAWDFDYYKAIDFSQNMCNLHPHGTNIDVKCFDFDTPSFLENIKFNSDKPALSLLSDTSFSKEIRIVFKKGQVMEDHEAPFFMSGFICGAFHNHGTTSGANPAIRRCIKRHITI